MDFDCWTGIKIGTKPCTIVEKIRYKEKTSDDVWTEYKLITNDTNAHIWLSITDDGRSCIISSPAGNKVPKGYRLHDSGTEVVTGVWGDTDVAVGDETRYEQYESADGRNTFFVEYWNGSRSSSQGGKISASTIIADTDTDKSTRQKVRAIYRRSRLRNSLIEPVAGLAGACVILLLSVAPDFDMRDYWHAFRDFVNLPYVMHERLSDAPYHTEQQEEAGTLVYTAQVDAGIVALDLIEGVDGRVEDAYERLGDAEHPIIIRTREETARITSAADGTAHIVVTQVSPDRAPAADRLQRSHTLFRYAVLVRTGDTRGRAEVITETP